MVVHCTVSLLQMFALTGIQWCRISSVILLGLVKFIKQQFVMFFFFFPGVALHLMQSLLGLCLTSLALNPKHFQPTEDDPSFHFWHLSPVLPFAPHCILLFYPWLQHPGNSCTGCRRLHAQRHKSSLRSEAKTSRSTGWEFKKRLIWHAAKFPMSRADILNRNITVNHVHLIVVSQNHDHD